MLTKIEMGVWESNSEFGHSIECIHGIDPQICNYEIVNITGLEPPRSEVRYSEFAMAPGGHYHSSSPTIRNVVITLALHPHYASGRTHLDLRRDLYRALPTRTEVGLKLWRDGEYEMYLRCYVEEITPNIFSKDPEITVSLVATDPYFSEPWATSRIWDGENAQARSLYHSGDVTVGGNFHINISGRINGVHVRNLITGGHVSILHVGEANDRLVLSTHESNKSLTLRSVGSETIRDYLMGRVSVVTEWPMFVPGENQFQLSTFNGTDNIDWQFHVGARYSGF